MHQPFLSLSDSIHFQAELLKEEIYKCERKLEEENKICKNIFIIKNEDKKEFEIWEAAQENLGKLHGVEPI